MVCDTPLSVRGRDPRGSTLPTRQSDRDLGRWRQAHGHWRVEVLVPVWIQRRRTCRAAPVHPAARERPGAEIPSAPAGDGCAWGARVKSGGCSLRPSRRMARVFPDRLGCATHLYPDAWQIPGLLAAWDAPTIPASAERALSVHSAVHERCPSLRRARILRFGRHRRCERDRATDRLCSGNAMASPRHALLRRGGQARANNDSVHRLARKNAALRSTHAHAILRDARVARWPRMRNREVGAGQHFRCRTGHSIRDGHLTS